MCGFEGICTPTPKRTTNHALLDPASRVIHRFQQHRNHPCSRRCNRDDARFLTPWGSMQVEQMRPDRSSWSERPPPRTWGLRLGCHSVQATLVFLLRWDWRGHPSLISRLVVRVPHDQGEQPAAGEGDDRTATAIVCCRRVIRAILVTIGTTGTASRVTRPSPRCHRAKPRPRARAATRIISRRVVIRGSRVTPSRQLFPLKRHPARQTTTATKWRRNPGKPCGFVRKTPNRWHYKSRGFAPSVILGNPVVGSGSQPKCAGEAQFGPMQAW